MPNATYLRIWFSTKDRIKSDIVDRTGMPLVRTVDVLTHGWVMLTDAQRQQVRADAARVDADATTQRTWLPTVERIEAIRHETGMDRVRVFEALRLAWEQLTDEQRAEATRLSMVSELEADAA